MRVLLIKTSSLGDVVHALPAVTEACEKIPGLQFDWMVEESFVEIPEWHPGVGRVLPVALRRWRKQPFQALRSSEWRALREHIKAGEYDLVIDAQGLLKSAFLVWLVGSNSVGYDRESIREPLATLFYQQKIKVSKELHAVERIRQLFAGALNYSLTSSTPTYGVKPPVDEVFEPENIQYLVWLHGSTWDSKLWPEAYWIELSQLAVDAGYEVLIPWGDGEERKRAIRVETFVDGVTVLPQMTLGELALVLSRAVGVVGVDGGPAHLAAAVSVPMICLYGATRPLLTGSWGENCHNLQGEAACVPCLKRKCTNLSADGMSQACFTTLQPKQVFQQLMTQISSHNDGDGLRVVR
ncbi:MAG: lipopolysaccharide heptosyltransferase I [Immundisolibacteraceae bacterium]|nr:lipopolysaccharide heptosyltransferase I [Immundisolibacteraceae bacterium]